MLETQWRGPGRPRVSDDQKRLRGTDRGDRYPGSRAKRQPEWRPHWRHFAGLSPRAAAFIRRVVARTAERGLELTPKGGRIVVLCAREMDELEALRAAVAREEPRVAGSRGRLKVNPKVRELRKRDRVVDVIAKHFDVPRG